MSKILLLGGNGFIGKNIIEKFAANDNSFVLLDKKPDSLDSILLLNPKIKVIEGELSNIELIKDIIINHEIEVVIHLVSSLIPSSTLDEFHIDLISVVYPTFKLIDFLSLNNIKFVFFSSGGTIYGNSQEPLLETHNLAPINFYGYSKLMIERYIQFKSRTDHLKFLILRPSNVFGKFQRLNGKQGFIAVATRKILAGEAIEIWGNGKTVRDYINVSDVVNALFELLKIDIVNEVINIGCGKGNNLLEIIDILEKCLNRSANIIYKEKRLVDVDYMVLNVGKLSSLISFTPMPIDKGIQMFIETINNDC